MARMPHLFSAIPSISQLALISLHVEFSLWQILLGSSIKDKEVEILRKKIGTFFFFNSMRDIDLETEEKVFICNSWLIKEKRVLEIIVLTAQSLSHCGKNSTKTFTNEIYRSYINRYLMT